jgi:hypothetical protein
MAIPVFPGEVAGSGVIYKRGMLPTLPIRDNLAAWFRYGVGITTVSGLVSQWNDASGKDRHLKQGTAANRPLLLPDNAILFDGVDEYLKCDAFTLNQPETVYLLGKQVAWTANDYFYDGNAVNSGAMFQRLGSTNRISIQAGAVGPFSDSLGGDVYGVIACVFNGAASAIQVNLTATTVGDAGAANMGGFTLGCAGNTGAFGNVAVKEVVIYAGAHSPAQRETVIRYLAKVGRVAV